MKRPELTPDILLVDFQDFYWLKEELIAFCRQQGLPTGGSKEVLAARISGFLTRGKLPEKPVSFRSKTPSGKMPVHFSRESVIGANWRCSEPLRAFLEREIGPKFHFDAAMRDFVKKDIGKTLDDMITCWYTTQQMPKAETIIDNQFEYNRFIRDFFKTNPGKSLSDAITAWKEKKARRKED
ncbi:MAG: cytoplasmic protein [Chloroflexi bacterium HGW-Chloroflexi-10]|nr:MAG: cytoplasmic protein [Chloroflexi bacterium HGW-Chloroflexi-10]